MNKIDTKAMREKILDLAMRGKLVPQDPNDEPASELLKIIQEEKEQLIASKTIKKQNIPLNWILTPLSSIFEKTISGEWGKALEGNQKGYPVIRTTNFTDEGYINFNEITYRNIDIEKKINKKLVFGDLIIEKSGGGPKKPVGRVVKFELENTELPYFCNNFTNILRPKSSIYYLYAFYLLKDLYNKGLTKKFQSRTTGIANLKIKPFLEVQVIIPPLPEQQRIVSKIEELFSELDKIDKAQETYDSAAKQLREKVLDCAMRGKLVPQDPNDEPASELLKRIEEEKQQLIEQFVICLIICVFIIEIYSLSLLITIVMTGK